MYSLWYYTLITHKWLPEREVDVCVWWICEYWKCTFLMRYIWAWHALFCCTHYWTDVEKYEAYVILSPCELTICMSFDTQEFLRSFVLIVISAHTSFFSFGLSLQFQQRMAHRAHKIKSTKQVLEISQYGNNNMVRNAPTAGFCSSSL